MKVIVSVGGSEGSIQVVEAVRRRSWPSGTIFVVLAVVPRRQLPPPPPPMLMLLRTGGLLPTGGNRLAKRVAHARVTVQLAVEMLRSADLEAHGEVRLGHARREILRATQELSADLIVIGSAKMPAWPSLLWGGWGGLASRVSASARCSVDVVRETGGNVLTGGSSAPTLMGDGRVVGLPGRGRGLPGPTTGRGRLVRGP